MKNLLLAINLILLFSCSTYQNPEDSGAIKMERLYFGRNSNGVFTVTDSLWTIFLQNVVSPKFSSGYTVIKAEGKWLGADGKLENEESFIIEWIHDKKEPNENGIEEIIEDYKIRFKQESVLWITLNIEKTN
jgi:hypothetical protein